MREACTNREQCDPNGVSIINQTRELLHGESTPYGTKGHTVGQKTAPMFVHFRKIDIL